MLVVDDDQTVLTIVARYLERAGFEACVAATGMDGLRCELGRRLDLAVLDLVMPDLDGYELMRQLHLHEQLPVILLTARGDTEDGVTGLGLGADDYVSKPFSPRELIARIEAVLRRIDGRSVPASPLVLGQLAIDPVARRVSRHGREIRLTRLEYELLLFFARHPDRVFTRDELIDAVWRQPIYYETSAVAVHIRRLRAKIEENPSRPRLLQTVWGVGYRFVP